MANKKIKEMSSTGGGAAPGTGATAIPGTGEGMATKYAFGKANLPSSKKKKKSSLKEEEVESGTKPYGKYSDTIKDASREFFALTISKCFENPEILDDLYNKMEDICNVLTKAANKYETTDMEKFKKLDNAAMSIVNMQNILSDLKNTFKKAKKTQFNTYHTK
jgi:hypothetical protein